MNIYERIEEIANICNSIIEASGLYLDNKKVTPDEWRAFMKRQKEAANEIAKDIKKKEDKKEKLDEEETEKKHWSQYKSSDTNQYFKNKYKKTSNNYAEGQRKNINSYQNYLDKRAKDIDSQATEMYLQAKEEAKRAFKDFRSGKITAKEYAQAMRAMQKLRPGATSEYTKDKYEKSQERKNQTYNN